jgi:Helix-loop-helix DNA-binding domain
MSVASIVSPSSYGFSQPFYEPNTHGIAAAPGGDSRRESVDSRLGVNFGDMRLANSPYASANQSTTSLQSSLAQQRNPGSAHPDRNSGPFRLSNGYQPTYQRLPDAPSLTSSRTAPLITGPALGAIARAPEPTKGQAWAFPEEEVQRMPSAARPSEEIANRQGTSYYDDSRRNSFADSIASSQYTAESRLPPGQRRLEDGMPAEYRPSRASSEYQVSTHHHSLQHRQIGELQNGEGGSPTSSQPYSRTPELRVSHKLAERKRRMEMKDLFDTLRIAQGVERGAKASKWEILTKGMYRSII